MLRTLVPTALATAWALSACSSTGTPERTSTHSSATQPTGSVVRTDASWSCTRPVDLDLVKITMRSASDHAVYLDIGCTGRIVRIEIDTWTKDGVKVRGASDLVVNGGYIACHGRDLDVHQDGVQAQGGQRVTFRNLTVDCPSSNNAAFFVSKAGSSTPTDIVCDRCTLKAANSTVNIKLSVRSGVRDSTVCRGRTGGIRIQFGAIDPVDTGNEVLSPRSPRCESNA
jgi:hypothetical protein